MTHLLLRTYVSTQTAFAALADRISFEPQDARKEEGAETVQVIMIMGIMAVIIGVIFFGPFGLKQTLKDFGGNVSNCISSITGGGSTCSF